MIYMEYWDLYDENKNKLNKIVKRGDKLNDDEFHLVINAWIKNKNNEFLITQRKETKTHPLMWETTGGSALLGEDSLEAAVREIKEELGLVIDSSNAKLIGTTKRYYKRCPDILDVWIFESNVKLEDIKIQEEEVNDFMWADSNTIRNLYKQNKFEANAYFEEALEFIERS